MGQIYVISSESILLPVVRALSLASDPEFVGEQGTESVGSRIRGLFRSAAHAVGLPEDKPLEMPSKETLEKVAVDGVLRNLSVTREDVASVINVAFSSKDPVKASTIANAIVDTYLDAGVAGKVKSTKMAGKVVQERVDELKRLARDAERALLDYKIANNLTGNSRNSPAAEQLATLQSHLTSARVAMAEAKARMERLASAGSENSFVTDDGLITRLRSQLSDLSVRANDFENRVGKDHVATVKVRNQMKELREAIASEQLRISGSFSKDYELARARYDEISATMTRLMGEEGANGDTQAKIRELESAADTLRSQYNRAVQQLGEMSKVEAQPSVAPDAIVLMRAAPPTQTEASKKRVLILAGGTFLGLLLGGCFRPAKGFSVRCVQNGAAGDRRDGLILRRPAGDRERRGAGGCESRRVCHNCPLFAVCRNAAQYLGLDQHRSAKVGCEGDLCHLFHSRRRQDDRRDQSCGTFRPPVDDACAPRRL